MAELCRSHITPHAGIEPVDDPATALGLLISKAAFPLAPQTIAVILDRFPIGHCALVVDGADSPDAVVRLAEAVSAAIPGRGVPAASDVLLASIRPQGRLDEGDGDRWLEMCDLLEQRGARLLEWFVVTGPDVLCPRDFLGVPSRFGRRAA